MTNHAGLAALGNADHAVSLRVQKYDGISILESTANASRLKGGQNGKVTSVARSHGATRRALGQTRLPRYATTRENGRTIDVARRSCVFVSRMGTPAYSTLLRPFPPYPAYAAVLDLCPVA